MSAAPTRSWFWGAFVVVIVVLALLAGYATVQQSRQLAGVERQPRSAPASGASTEMTPADRPPELLGLIELVLNGERRYFQPDALRDLAPGLGRRAAAEHSALRSRLEVQIRAGVEAAFAPAEIGVPRFTDWYYSLQGEYARYAQALGGDLAGYLADQLRGLVLEPANLEGRLDGLQRRLDGELAAGLRSSLDALTAELNRLAAARAEPIEVVEGRGRVQGRLDLDHWLTERLAVDAGDLGQEAAAALAGAGVGAVVAKGLGAVVVKKVVAKVAGATGFQAAVALLAKAGAKGAVKGGGVLAAGAGGAVLCSPSGPVALLCGALAGLTTWLAVDKAFVELDEMLNREAFEAELRAAIAAEKQRLIADMVRAYDRLVTSRYLALAQDLMQARPAPGVGWAAKTFVPAEAVSKGDAPTLMEDARSK